MGYKGGYLTYETISNWLSANTVSSVSFSGSGGGERGGGE